LEATKQLHLENVEIKTPLSPMTGSKLTDDVVVVPVLRAGLAMLFALQDFLPSVPVGFIGLERNEQTAIAREYYQKLPAIFATHNVIVLDPMLATGGSFDDTVAALKDKGAKKISCVCIISAPEGISRIEQRHPEVKVYAAAIDERLNDKKYIGPGLGDFGDRYFGT
jgi:uracil phosphoribosyltransferase